MHRRALSLGLTVAMAAMLWVVPSVGSLGQGTLGDRFLHPDSTIMTASAEPEPATRAALARADAIVTGAVRRL